MATRRAHGTGAIFRRADGRWSAEVDVGFVGGKRQRKTLYGRTKAEVVQKLKTVQSNLEQGKPLVNERRLTGDFLDHWLEDVVRPRREYSTYKGYEQRVRLYLKPDIGRVPLAKLTVEHVEGVLARARERGLAPRGVQYVLATLRAALSVAERRGYVARNVAKLVEPVVVERSEVQPFTAAEVDGLLRAAEAHRIGALFTVAFSLGLRPEEALGLSWDAIDLDGPRPTLRVRQVVKRGPTGLVISPKAKTDRSRRTLPIPKVCVAALRRHRAGQAEERLVAGERWCDHGLVFTTRTGRPLDHRYVVRTWDRIQENAGVERHRLYDARHTAATFLLAQGVPPRVVMEILGHSTYQLTMDLYSHVVPALLDEAAEAMDRVLGSH